MTFLMYILDVFIAQMVQIDPANAEANFNFILYGHCK